ncbi:MAG TPA: SAM-dependent methyltransferase [Nitrospira sp.]
MILQSSQPKSDVKARSRTEGKPSGTLFVVGTPIGSLEELTARAIKTLQNVSIVAAERPLVTQRLFDRHKIRTTLTSYGPRYQQEKIAVLIQRMSEGRDVALVCDSGMPVVADPGRLLIAASHQAGIQVRVIPGASALTAAIAVSGQSGDSFVFESRLPQGGRLYRFLARFQSETRTVAFFVQSGFLKTVMEGLARVLPRRTVTVAVDLAEPQETLLRGTSTALLRKIDSLRGNGHVTIVLQGGRPGSKIKRERRSKPVSR